MNVIQRNNKHIHTRFSRMKTGAVFNTGPNQNLLVKVDSNSFGVWAPGPINGVSISSVFVPGTGPVFYYNPPQSINVGGLDNSLVVEDPYSNPVGGAGGITPDTSVIEQDPPYYLDQSSYLLSAVYNSNGTVDLSWIYPNLKLGLAASSVHIKNIVLQRSTSTRQTPYGPTGDGAVNANLNVSKYSEVIADPAWTTLFNESLNYNVTGAPPYAVTDSYTDTPPASTTSHVFHYRLIIFVDVNPNATPIHLPFELDFNVITIVTPYSLTVSNGVLSWDSPSSAELASLSRLFLNSFTAVRGGTTYATTLAQFNMPPADGITQTANIPVSTNSFIIGNNIDGYVMTGAGTIRIARGSAPNTIRVINPSGYSGNAPEGTPINSGAAIKSTTQLSWVFDLSDLPTDYSLQKRTSELDPWVTAVTLPNNFVQPFKDEDPPNPDIFYRLVANMPASQGISFAYNLYYTAGSV